MKRNTLIRPAESPEDVLRVFWPVFCMNKRRSDAPKKAIVKMKSVKIGGKSGRNMKLKKSIKSNYASSKNAGSPEVFWVFLGPFWQQETLYFARGNQLWYLGISPFFARCQGLVLNLKVSHAKFNDVCSLTGV